MPGHNHHKEVAKVNDKVERADFLTLTSGITDFTANLLGTTISIAQMVDLLNPPEDEIDTGLFDASTLGLSIGFGIGLFSVIGAAYCHLILNRNNQTKKSNNTDIEEGQSIINSSNNINADYGTQASPVYDLEKGEVKAPKAKLSWGQVGALFFDGWSHTMEKATPAIFAIESVFQSKLTLFGRIAAISGSTGVALVGSLADVRTCKNNLEKYNQEFADAAFEVEQRKNGITKI